MVVSPVGPYIATIPLAPVAPVAPVRRALTQKTKFGSKASTSSDEAGMQRSAEYIASNATRSALQDLILGG